jgi:diguanylate cyclase (GGDEF)-like protein
MFTNDEFLAILATLPDPAFILTRSGRYVAVYGGSDSRYYHDGHNLVGRLISDVVDQEKATWVLSHIEKTLASEGLQFVEYSLAGNDIKGLHDQGPERPIWFEARIQKLNFLVDGEEAVLWVASNITHRHDLQEQLRTQSETDPLTGLANRRKLMKSIKSSYEIYTRYRIPTSILAFDIDNLKNINDQHGHLIGDKVITALAAVCKKELRATDLPARFGGDEFVVLLPQTDLHHAESMAERIRQQAALTFRDLNIMGANASVSIGLSEFHSEDTHFEQALDRADNALYKAKTQGRNRVVVF